MFYSAESMVKGLIGGFRKQPDVSLASISWITVGNPAGPGDVASGNDDVVFLPRVLTPQQQERHPQVVSHIVGWEAFVIIVNPDVGVDNLTLHQVQEVFSG